MHAAANALQSAVEHRDRVHTAEYYRAEIDGLRGIAVLAVIGFHAFPDYFPGGFVGVDVFFVISGFLISSIILRQLQRSTFTISDFYARRIRRIFPALLIVLTACLLFGGLALLPDELELLGKHVGSAAIFVSNFTLWLESGYFDTAAEFKPLLHLWSLGIEEQFYLIWPMLLLLLWKARQRLGAIVALLTLASFALCVTVGTRNSVANFYFPFTRFWELGLGCLLAIAKESPGTLGRSWSAGAQGLLRLGRVRSLAHVLLPILGIVLIAVSVFLFDRHTAFPGWASLLPTAGAMCIILAPRESWLQRRVMASAALVFIGLISYPLYLWHWPLLSFAAILEAGTPDTAVRAIAVLLSIVAAWLTFIFFERPIRAQRKNRVSVALAVGLSIIGAAGLATYSVRGFPHRFDVDVRALRTEPRINALCPNGFEEGGVLNYCKSTRSETPAAVFLGDSRAQGVYEGVVDALGTRQGLTLLARGGCPPLLGADLHFRDQERCPEAWRSLVEYVESVKPPVVVVVGGGADLLDPAVATLDPGSHFTTREEAYRHGLRELVAALAQTSRVIYVRELPKFQSAPSCFLRPITLPGSQCTPAVSRKTVEAEAARYDRIVDEVRQQTPELLVVDSIPAMCNGTTCSQKLPSGQIGYSDRLHLSAAGGQYFARTSGLVALIEDELLQQK